MAAKRSSDLVAIPSELQRSLPATERARCAQALEKIRRSDDVDLFATELGDHRWRVVVCAADRVGLLSLIAGLLASHRIGIIQGDICTLPTNARAVSKRGPQRSPRTPLPTTVRRKVLDVFEVGVPGSVEATFWTSVRDDFAELVKLAELRGLEAAREQIIDRVSSSMRDDPATSPLLPVVVEMDNAGAESATQLHIRAADTVGFVFEFANALSMLNVNIERVSIRTESREVRDTFWVTDAHGAKITDDARLHELRVAAALIKQFTHLLPRSPNPAQALREFSALARDLLDRPDWVDDLRSLESNSVLRTLADLMGVSQFLWEDFLRIQHENLFPVVRDTPALDVAHSPAELHAVLAHELRAASDSSARTERLNQFKDLEMFRIDLRHLTGRTEFEQFSAELTDLAEVVVAAACELCHAKLKPKLGIPRLANNRACPWCVCALGKFGGRELGFASDVELLFVYAGNGTTSGPLRIETSRYFDEFVSEFLRTLQSQREGVFEIDLRLRPFGKAGSLACSLEGFAEYFCEKGGAEQFERMALVKLRPIAGDESLAMKVLQARDAFVYSGAPFDYEYMRHLRQRQANELVPRGLVSAKHSPGGLVEVEYFVQAKQIETAKRRNGESANRRIGESVDVTNTLEAVVRLQQAGAIAPSLADEIRTTYAFLRRLIDALRVVRGHAKDLTIPPAESREFAYLARRLQFESSERLQDEIARRMKFARELWNPYEPRR